MSKRQIVEGGSLLLAASLATWGQTAGPRVREDTKHNVHVLAASGKETVIAHHQGQVGIDEIKVAEDKRTVGWLILYENPGGSTPLAATLVVWREGRVLRKFETEQVFWSWAFAHGAEQVVYHVGPTHGESVSHCELHDVRTGRLLAGWDGELDGVHKPAWTKPLDH